MQATEWMRRLGGAAWAVWIEMAPYLLFGFVVAGALSVWLSAAWVQRRLGGGGWRAALRASLLGVPLPLCSCSVIPVSVSLREQGASRGATGAFMMATPQVGVNSLFVTYGLLGPFMTLARAAIAFVSGLLCGTLVDATDRENLPAASAQDPVAAGGSCAIAISPIQPAWRRALRHAFVTLPRSIAVPVLVGMTVSALIGAFLPDNFFAERLAPGFGAMGLMLLIGIPMYVCSTSSTPVALALILAGVPEGAVLVFLITGPATNAATLTTLWRLLGSRATLIYLAVLTGTALLAGWTLDAWLLVRRPDLVTCHAPEGVAALWRHAAGMALLILLAIPTVRKLAQAVRGGEDC